MRWGPVRSPLSFCRLSFLRETRKKPFSAKNIKYENIFLNYFPQSFRLTCFLANSYSLDQPKHRVLHTLSEKWTRYNQRLKFIRKKGNSVTLIDFFFFRHMQMIVIFEWCDLKHVRLMCLKHFSFESCFVDLKPVLTETLAQHYVVLSKRFRQNFKFTKQD